MELAINKLNKKQTVSGSSTGQNSLQKMIEASAETKDL